MRDIVITAVIFAILPLILRRPWIGVLTFAWLSLMTPHRFAFGFAYDFPFAAIVAACTFAGLFLSREEVKYDSSPIMILLLLLPLWMFVTWIFAFDREGGTGRLSEVLKVFLFVHISAMVLRTRQQAEWMLWVIVISVGFFGAKGGVFTVLTGGGGRVYGPPGDSFLSDNNAISVALVMTIPLMYYLRGVSQSVWVRHGLMATILLSFMAILGSYSRGAFLAVACMLMFLWLKSRKKLLAALVLLPLIPVAIGLMPERWGARMNTISTYEQDSSAMGRINSWKTATNIANHRPLVGGGFEYYSPEVFAKYAPDPLDVHSAHSVYFQILGEHGYVGLAIFLSIGFLTWRAARQTIARSGDRPDLAWARQLSTSIQVSLIGFAVGGAFVNIGYWDLQYYEVVILLVAQRLVAAQVSAKKKLPA